ncbi:MAG: hypothetical protein LBC43_03215, partial [Bifidobacteriaceae bacterium]|nr:hypothetical protein [Bifidobacteriaceae bacterium]
MKRSAGFVSALALILISIINPYPIYALEDEVAGNNTNEIISTSDATSSNDNDATSSNDNDTSASSIDNSDDSITSVDTTST